MTELSIINDAIKSGFDYVINSVMYRVELDLQDTALREGVLGCDL